jgi:hypothetical protein
MIPSCWGAGYNYGQSLMGRSDSDASDKYISYASLEEILCSASLFKQPNNQTTKQPNNQTTKQPNNQTTKPPKIDIQNDISKQNL